MKMQETHVDGTLSWQQFLDSAHQFQRLSLLIDADDGSSWDLRQVKVTKFFNLNISLFIS